MDIRYVELLKAYGSKKDLCEGARLHEHILQHHHGLLEKNPRISTTLISMYAKCGALPKARQLFQELPAQDVVSWNALISGYAQHGQPHEALHLFETMRKHGLSPNPSTCTSALKACGSSGEIGMGQQIHHEIVAWSFLEKNRTVLGNALVGMYAKYGMLTEASRMLEQLHNRDVISWSALIGGYAEKGHGEQALICFEKMQREGIAPNEVTFICVLKACRSIGAIDKGKQIHNEITGLGLLKKNLTLGNALVDLYARCGLLAKAQEVLEELQIRDVVSWNSLISGYIYWQQWREALHCFERMQGESVPPDQVTLICILKACGNVRNSVKGEQFHDDIVNRGLFEKNIVLGNALVDMYAKCGLLWKAQQVLDELPVRDVVSWSALIAGYTQEGRDQEALNCFELMQREGVCPNAVTFICILKSCGSVGAIDKGKQIHDEILNKDLLRNDIILGNALVDMYAKCGFLLKAQQVLEEHPHRNVVTWNALIDGYVEHQRGQEAMECYASMQREGLAPNEATIISMLKVCGDIRSVAEGKRLHIKILNNAWLEKNIQLGNALVDMYAKCGFLAKAHHMLEELPNRNTVSWNTQIAGYTQHKRGHEALKCFEQMQREGISADEVTFTCIVNACSIIGAIEKGKDIHDVILSKGLLQSNAALGNALVDMYAKCGAFTKAQEVLDELRERDTVSWSALLAGYALKGNWLEALNCWEQMQTEGYVPNEITLLCMLGACCHSGKLKEAETYFEKISKKYGITPTSEHHTCMVVGFGCAGHFDKALSIIKSMPCFMEPSVWLRVLGSCKKWGNMKLGKLAFGQARQLDDDLSAAQIGKYRNHAFITFGIDNSLTYTALKQEVLYAYNHRVSEQCLRNESPKK